MAIIGLRQTEVAKLFKNTRLLYRALGVESITVESGTETLVQGSDFVINPDGGIELTNEAHEGKDAVIIYNR